MAFLPLGNNTNEPYAQAFSSPKFNFGYPEGVSIVDVVPANIRPLVHPHWNQFPPVNPMWHYVLGVGYIILGVLSFFGNGMVMRLYMTNRSLKTPSNKLVFNLALSDFIMLITNFPFFAYNCFNGGIWAFSSFFCELYAFFGAITGFCSIWTLACISYDRYNVIVKGVSGKPLTSKKATMMILGCWTLAVAWSIPPFFGWGKYIPEGILDSCSFDYLSKDFNIRSYGIAICFSDFVTPLLIIVYSYFFIVQAIFSHENTMREQAKKMNVTNLRSNQDANAQRAEVRIAKVALTNIALWLICWVPYAAICVQGLFFDASTITPLVSILPSLLAKTSAVYNPIVYAINHPKFRQAIQKDMPWFCIHETDKSDTKSVASVETTTKETEAS